MRLKYALEDKNIDCIVDIVDKLEYIEKRLKAGLVNYEFIDYMLEYLFQTKIKIFHIERELVKGLCRELQKEKKNNTIIKYRLSLLKVGEIAQNYLMPLLESKQWNDRDMETFLSKETKNIFDLNIPLLSVDRYVYTKEGKKYTRYYKKPIKVNGKDYFMCSQWDINNELLKEQLINFIQKHS